MNSTLRPDDFVRAAEFIRIGRRAVKRAQEESRRLGVPNVYSINGMLYYELPNGELSRTDPYDGSRGGSMNESQEPAG